MADANSIMKADSVKEPDGCSNFGRYRSYIRNTILNKAWHLMM